MRCTADYESENFVSRGTLSSSTRTLPAQVPARSLLQVLMLPAENRGDSPQSGRARVRTRGWRPEPPCVREPQRAGRSRDTAPRHGDAAEQPVLPARLCHRLCTLPGGLLAWFGWVWFIKPVCVSI